MTRLSKPLRLLVMVTAAALFLSGVGMAAAALYAGPRAVWMLFGFETVVCVAGALAFLFGLGRFQDGQGLAMASVAGTVAAASVLGWLSSGPNQHLVVESVSQPLSLLPWLFGRLAAAALLALIGGVLVLSRDKRSLGLLGRAAATGIPLVLALAAAVIARGRLAGVVNSMPTWVLAVTVVIVGIAGVALASASVHWLVKAFEMGRTDRGQPNPS